MFTPGPPAGKARPFAEVQQSVADLIRGKVLIGHTLWHDLSGRSGILTEFIADAFLPSSARNPPSRS